MTHKTDGPTVTTIFQNRKEPTQTWTLVMNEDEITATADKKLSGLKVGKLFYKNGKWTTNGAQDAKNFLRDKQNFTNLTKEADAALDLFEDTTDIKYNRSKPKLVRIPSANELVSSATANVDIPKDPEGFFIARYPINQKDTGNFDFLKITCYDYQQGDFGETSNLFKLTDIDKRIKKRRGVISLPMQPGISESNSVGWGNNELNPLQMAGANLATEGIETAAKAISGGGFDLTGLLQKSVDTGKAVAAGLSPELIKAFFAQQAIGANLIGRSTGLTINNNLEVLFNGPNLRSFNYNYRFTPREPKEADKIKQIIRFFKKQMAPKRSTSRIFLKSPNVWKLKYTYKNGDSHPFLNNIKICALNQFTVDYTPDGSYSTYEDDGGRGDGSMTSYQVSLGFLEMTPIYNDDFWNDDEGKEGTGF
tara:strand:+ start:840 stop:2102 length:1263 start_codon:yes stop_codon:yes gene_type:complete